MKKAFKMIWSILKNTLLVVLVLFTILLLTMKIMGDRPTLFGYNLYYIVSPSMEPSLEVGDIILSKEVKDPSTLQVHDVITYKGEVGSFSGKLVTHELIEIKEHSDGSLSFLTKGTKEGAIVDPEIRSDQVVSKMIFEIPLLGKIMQLLSNQIVFFIFVIIPLVVCLFIEIVHLINVIRGKDEEDEEN